MLHFSSPPEVTCKFCLRRGCVCKESLAIPGLTSTSHSRRLTHYAIEKSPAEDRSVCPRPQAYLLPTPYCETEGSQAPEEWLARQLSTCSLQTVRSWDGRDRYWDSDRNVRQRGGGRNTKPASMVPAQPGIKQPSSNSIIPLASLSVPFKVCMAEKAFFRLFITLPPMLRTAL